MVLSALLELRRLRLSSTPRSTQETHKSVIVGKVILVGGAKRDNELVTVMALLRKQ